MDNIWIWLAIGYGIGGLLGVYKIYTKEVEHPLKFKGVFDFIKFIAVMVVFFLIWPVYLNDIDPY